MRSLPARPAHRWSAAGGTDRSTAEDTDGQSWRGSGRPSDTSSLTVVVAICALASPLGYALLDGASAWLLASIFAFAAGAILTMLATSMMPMA